MKINSVKINPKKFPNNERIFPEINGGSYLYNFELDFVGDEDITLLMFYKKYIDDIYPNSEKNLILKYIPYSRMDRKISPFVFSLKYFCDFINDLNFNKVIVLDAHSNVSTALLKRCVELSIKPLVDHVFSFEKNIDYVFYPDAGAMKRYSEADIIPKDFPYFYGNKRRNLKTGEIIDFSLVEKPNLQNKKVLIIDDLCSKGGTFLASAQKIKEEGASDVILYVTHCENSIYDGDIFKTDLISKVYTTDSILNDFSNFRLKQISNNIISNEIDMIMKWTTHH